VVQLGGGRTTPGAAIDPSVGLAGIAELGDIVEAGEPLAVVHAASDDDAELAARRVRDAMTLSENTTATAPLIHQTIRRQAR
jgi:thymidine phosphorylase